MSKQQKSHTKSQEELSTYVPDSSVLTSPGLICLCECLDINEDEHGEWKDSGKRTKYRWVMPQAVVDLTEDNTDGRLHYIVTVEFSARHYDWNAQRLRFGADKEKAFKEAEELAIALSKWPLSKAETND